MQSLGIIKKYLIVFGVLAVACISFVALNVTTSSCSNAQMCGYASCGYTSSQCTYAPTPTLALGSILSTAMIDMVAVTGYLAAYYQFAIGVGWLWSIEQKIREVRENQIGWWDTFWYYNLRPAMMDMTDQLVTMDKHQDVQLAKFADAINLTRTNNDMIKSEIDAHREQRPGELICQVASAGAGGLGRTAVFVRNYAGAAAAAAAARSGNAVGTPGAQGNAANHRVRWNNYASKYCDPNENAGFAGCGPAGPPPNPAMVNRDVNVTGEIFEKDTINIKDADTNTVIEDLLTNIYEPRVREPIPQGTTKDGGSKGHQQVLNGESYKAKRNAAQDALRFVVARRVPGSQTGEFLEQMRGTADGGAGIPTVYIAPGRNPSKNEIMQVMMDERFRTGTYSIDQVDNPENNGREMVIQQAFQAMQLSDQIDLIDRYSVLLAAELSPSVRGNKSLLEDTDDRPNK